MRRTANGSAAQATALAPSGDAETLTIDLSKFAYTDVRGRRSKLLPGVNIGELAAACGVRRGYMTNVLNGVHVPGRELLGRLARELNVSWEDADRWLVELRKKRKKLNKERQAELRRLSR